MITITAEQIERVNLILSGVPGGIEKALSSTIRRANNTVRSETLKGITTVYAITRQNVRAETTIKVRTQSSDGGIVGTVLFAGHKIPLYLLLQYIKSTDTQEQGQDPESECTVRIVAATYSEDESEGAMCVLNLLTRIRVALLKDGVVGGQFVLKSPLEMIVYPDSTAPYYLGEMMTTWAMPIIESEVQQIWQ